MLRKKCNKLPVIAVAVAIVSLLAAQAALAAPKPPSPAAPPQAAQPATSTSPSTKKAAVSTATSCPFSPTSTSVTSAQTSTTTTCYYPSVTVTADQTALTDGGSTNVHVTVNSTPPNDTCTLQNNGSTVTLFTTDASGAGSWTFGTGALSVGTYTFSGSCPAAPSAGSGSVVITVTSSSSGGGGGGGGGTPTPTGPPTPQPPDPAISGTPTVGSTLTAIRGGWLGSPTNFYYQWERICNGVWTMVQFSPSNTYVVQAADTGCQIDMAEDAYNAYGWSQNWSSWSAPTATVTQPVTQPVPTPSPQASITVSNNKVTAGNSTSVSLNCSNSNAYTITANPSSGGSWSGLVPGGGVVQVTTPALAAGGYAYIGVCKNAAGATASSNVAVGAFSSNDTYLNTYDPGGDVNYLTYYDASNNCTWYQHGNQGRVHTWVGSPGGNSINVQWCARNGFIVKVIRTDKVLGSTYPLSYWSYEGITSYGPCDANCSNYVQLYGTTRTSINIWEQAHWDECVGIPFIGGKVCAANVFITVGLTIRGDGTYVKTLGD